MLSRALLTNRYIIGDVVPNKSLARRLPDGSTVYDCSDLMGRTRKNGDEYERPNARFKYRCDNGIERIVGKHFRIHFSMKKITEIDVSNWINFGMRKAEYIPLNIHIYFGN